VITPALEDQNDIVRYEAAAAVLRLSDGQSADSKRETKQRKGALNDR